MDEQKTWSIADANELYRINEWGNGYFTIDDNGEVKVSLKGKYSQSGMSLMEIATGLTERGLKMPVLLRFSNILDDRIQFINEQFLEAMKETNYKGSYRGV